jgi:C1A family cysteine protease
VVGYGQKPGYFTVRNSWDTNWGDRGDCYIPEAYLGSTTYGSDYWVIKQVG